MSVRARGIRGRAKKGWSPGQPHPTWALSAQPSQGPARAQREGRGGGVGLGVNSEGRQLLPGDRDGAIRGVALPRTGETGLETGNGGVGTTRDERDCPKLWIQAGVGERDI